MALIRDGRSDYRPLTFSFDHHDHPARRNCGFANAAILRIELPHRTILNCWPFIVRGTRVGGSVSLVREKDFVRLFFVGHFLSFAV